MRRAGFLVGVVTLLAASRGRAEERPRIAIIHDFATDERTVARLRAELSTLGLRVVDVALAPNEGASSLDDAARRVDAFAAVRVVPARGLVEVWVADRVTGKTLLRELPVGSGQGVDDVVALQAVELLRASLVELRLSPRPHGDVKAAPAVTMLVPLPPTPSRSARRVIVQIGPATALSPGGFSASGHAFLGLRFRPGSGLGLDAWSLIPIAASNTEAREGAATLSPLLFGVDAAVWLLDSRAPWQLAGGAGVAVARLGIDGHASPPLTDRAAPLTVLLPVGRLSASRRLAARFGLELNGFAGVALPHAIVQFDGRRVADWGRPLIVGTLSFDVALD